MHLAGSADSSTFLVGSTQDKSVQLHNNQHALPRVVDDAEVGSLAWHLFTDVVCQEDVLPRKGLER